MIPSLNDLRIVELDRLILHEAHDTNRLARLRRRVEAEGVQQHPVIVCTFEDDYLVLDGAHRVQAMGEIGCSFILSQVVELPEKAESWGHVLKGVEPRRFGEVEGIVVSDSAERWLAEADFLDGGHAFVKVVDHSLEKEVAALWSLQDLYPAKEVVHRVDAGTPIILEAGEAVIRYRTFTPGELVEVVRSGAVLPAGITRFRVRERVLGVRFPLEKLEGGSIDDRNEELRSFVAERWSQNRIRYYGEPVILFE